MNVFDLRSTLIEDYSAYISSFIRIRDPKIKAYVDESIDQGLLWPDPLIQLNPTFEPGHWIDELADEGVLHKHQEDAARVAREGHNYILTTVTGSGKSLAYIIPIVDFCSAQWQRQRCAGDHCLL
jgi:ATP-dependent helicase YprA (DUF1998 family)